MQRAHVDTLYEDIRSSALTPADTQQLVAAMVRGVRSVMLGELGTVTLHMETGTMAGGSVRRSWSWAAT